MEWQTIETAPKEGNFLVGGWISDGAGRPEIWEVSACWQEDDGFYCDVDVDGSTMSVAIDRITHWMPFPPPPEVPA